VYRADIKTIFLEKIAASQLFLSFFEESENINVTKWTKFLALRIEEIKSAALFSANSKFCNSSGISKGWFPYDRYDRCNRWKKRSAIVVIIWN